MVETDKSLELASEGGRPVVVRIGRGAVLRQRLEAESGRIDVIPGDEPRIAVKLSTVKVLDPRLPADLPEPTLVRTVHLTLLRFAEPIAQPLRETGALDLIRLAERCDEPDVTNGARLLVQEINDLRGRITSAVHERAAMAVCALLVMLMGAVMAMLLRQQVPLVIFFWCFLPAIVAIFMINGGKNMVEADALGVGQWFNAAMVWSGNAFLLAVIAVIYARLARH